MLQTTARHVIFDEEEISQIYYLLGAVRGAYSAKRKKAMLGYLDELKKLVDKKTDLEVNHCEMSSGDVIKCN